MGKKFTLLISIFLSFFAMLGAEVGNNNKIEFNSNNGILQEKLEFKVKSKENMQGLAYNNGFYYIGFDMKNNKGKIQVYDKKGNLKRESKLLDIGHVADLSFNSNKNVLYAVNGGGKNKTKVYEIDIEKDMKIIKTIDFSKLGNSGLMTFDNKENILILHTSNNDKSKHKFSKCNLDGEILETFEIDNIGVPQGIEYLNGDIYFYTNDKITVINFKDKKIVDTYNLNISGESEGVTFVKDENKVAYGYNKQNRIYSTEVKYK